LEIELLERIGDIAHLKFSVRDSGIGMTREQSARLFQPFTQADMSTTRKHGGTGLGLTICRRLVELMGGRIWLESEPGVGSTFFFTIRLPVGEAKGAGTIVPEKLTRLHVLVADDNPAAREILHEPLSAIVRRVDVVASGKEAIAAVQQHDANEPYDVVFMDWRMPGLDGLQASRQMKTDATLRHKPAIVLVTAFGRDDVREEADRLQLDGFLVKPVTKSMIVDTLVNIFAGTVEERAATVEGVEATPLRGARVLLAEDNSINQQIAVELLEGAGATVTVTNNGREAVELLSQSPTPPPFDVVLMDLQMPEMDGYQATAKLRSDAQFRTLPIIAMTAHATIEERQRCLASGMNDHIAKPIDPDNLFETIGRYYKPTRTSAERGIGVDPLRAAEENEPEASRAAIPALDRVEVIPAESEHLPSIAGLDTKGGLARVVGNRKLYLKLLRQFVEQKGAASEQITNALATGDIALAEQLAHSLRGVAANVGAISVQSTAGELEKRLRDGAERSAIDSAREHLTAALRPLIAQLRTALASSPPATAAQPPKPAPANPAQSRDAAARLIQLLSEFDPGSADFIASHYAALSPLFDSTTWPQFEALVEGYAFAEAQAQLERAVKHLSAAVG
jgi:two-component system sensor histidine kinase/response regulator